MNGAVEYGRQAGPEPWYRNPWVWFVLCVPLSAVAFGAVMLISANHKPDDLVVDEYYREGMGINRRLMQDDLAAALDASVRLHALTPEGAVFRIPVGSESVSLKLFHVRSRDLDISVPLVKLTGELYGARSALLAERLGAPGAWYLEVRDESLGWRLRSRLETPVQQLELQP